MKKIVSCAVLAITAFSPGFTNAAVVVRVSNIEQVLTTPDERFGGCMVRVSSNTLNCSDYISFDCTGELGTPKDQAYRMFDTAMMAFALGSKVRIWVEDTKKYGSNCVADKLIVLPSTP